MAESTATTFNLSHELVKSWSPCADGYRWFLGKFPQGGAYTAVHAALRADKRFDDAGWLFRAALSHALRNAPATTADIVAAQSDEAAKLIEGTSHVKVPNADEVKVTTEKDNGDDGAQIGSSGDGARIGSSGDDARINATGEKATIASSGIGARAKSGKDGAMALAYWDEKSGRTRFAVGYVGENIKPDVWYSLDAEGNFIESAA